MPGLEGLEAGHERVEIFYSELPNDARIEYETADPTPARTLHGWFDAQPSDQASHAEEDGQDPAEAGGHAPDHAQHDG